MPGATLRYDVAIVGAGPAGLSAALVLARGCRSVFVCDAGTPRSAVSHAMHGFLSRDGLPPGELRRIGREELARYPDVTVRDVLAQRLGCRLTRKGGIRCGQYEATDVPGVFVAGNLTKDVQLSIVAAAEGARAAFGIQRSLTREDFERRATGRRRIEHPPVDDPDTRRRRPEGG